MKILFVHNNYASNNSGEEHASQALANLLIANGHKVDWYRKSSDIIKDSVWMKMKAFIFGIYNPYAVKDLMAKINQFSPDIIQCQNLYPFISPAIIKPIKKLNIPLIMRCPNYRLFCPTGLHLDSSNKICESCLTKLKEFNCVMKNCEKNWFKSIGYALRNLVARKYWNITKLFDAYIVQTEFQKQKFVKNGISKEKLFVVPGLTPEIKAIDNRNIASNYVSFIGRVSEEKGIEEFIYAANKLQDISFKVVGAYSDSFINLKQKSSRNVEWTGFMSGKNLDEIFVKSRIIVVPGKWYEGFPNVITRAMRHGKAIITSDLGAMSSIIDHKKNGLLVSAGDGELLHSAIKKLFYDKSLCAKYGENAKKKASDYYSNKIIYEKLLDSYNYILNKNVI
ncbi:glycosyltransferase family 4 protein [Bacteroidota bacterium]|nr:glycosyltransferase family 4 protein [Bacteroidota bacterium]